MKNPPRSGCQQLRFALLSHAISTDEARLPGKDDGDAHPQFESIDLHPGPGDHLRDRHPGGAEQVDPSRPVHEKQEQLTCCSCFCYATSGGALVPPSHKGSVLEAVQIYGVEVGSPFHTVFKL